MIVPFGMIPQQFLAPLNVETKMEYKINKRKFPGLKDKSKHPALLIATKCDDIRPGHQQDAPIDLSQTGRRNAPVRCLHSTDSCQRLAEKKPTSRTRLRPNRSGSGSHSLSSGTRELNHPEGSRRDLQREREVTASAPQPELRPEGSSRATTVIATHPSYLDFIYGEHGIIAEMAAKRLANSAKDNPEQDRSASKAGKRKRQAVSGDADECHQAKKCKSSVPNDSNIASNHTIHYKPTAASVICGPTPTKHQSSMLFMNVQQMWPPVVSLGSYNNKGVITSQRTCGRQS